jgi:hypothetical protein
MFKLRAAVSDPDVSSFSHGPLSLAVFTDGKERFVEVQLEELATRSGEAKAAAEAANAQLEQGLRALAAHHHLGEPELVPDKQQPAAKAAETAQKEQ